MDNLKRQLKSEVEGTESEEKCLSEYRKELECLMQEKMAHVEELRQIHADIHAMEQVIKNAEQDRNHHLELAKHLHKECAPLKDLVNKLRSEINLPGLPEEEEEKIKPEFFDRHKFADWHHSDSHNPLADSSVSSGALPSPFMSAASQQQQQQQQMHLAAAAAAAQRAARSMIHHAPPPVHHPNPSSGGLSMTAQHGNQVVERPTPSAFRQQPPPMKSCLSCHQQIHRNAPICPLCKAKSRSRNPKKPKRKLED